MSLKNVSVTLSPMAMEKLNRQSKDTDMDKSSFIEMLIHLGVGNYLPDELLKFQNKIKDVRDMEWVNHDDIPDIVPSVQMQNWEKDFITSTNSPALIMDIGYGNTKVYNGKDTISFPSVYKSRWIGYMPENPKDQQLELDGVVYHVGEIAQILGGLSYFDRSDILPYKLLILTAICAINNAKDFSDSIAVGLPAVDYLSLADSVTKLKGYYQVGYNGEKVHINLTDVYIYNQSDASYKFISKIDKAVKDKTVGVLDIGYRYINFAYYSKNELVHRRSGSIEYGVIDAYHYIGQAICNKEGFLIDERKAYRFFKKFPNDTEKAFFDMAKIIKDHLARWHWKFNDMDIIYIIGGGASYISPFFKDTPYKELDETATLFASIYGYRMDERE